MGLDMYAFATKENFEGCTDFEVDDATEIHYWRKHPNLHGWMQQLYCDKGGTQNFNCVNVELTAVDLDELEHAIHMSELPKTRGFFFGESDGSEVNDDLLFVRGARHYIERGFSIYYTSWW